MQTEQQKPDTNSLLKFIWFFYKPYYVWVILILIVAGILSIVNITNSYGVKTIIDNINQVINVKKVYAGLYILIFAITLNHIGWRTQNFIDLKISPDIRSKIINYCFQYLHKQSYAFFANNLSGSSGSNINVLAENITMLVHKYLVTIVRAIMQTALVLFVLYSVNGKLMIVLLLWTICFISISVFFLKRFRMLSSEYSRAYAFSSGKIIDSISNFINVKIFGRSQYEQDALEIILTDVRKKQRKKDFALLTINVFQGISMIGLMSITAYIAINLKLQNKITIGDFTLTLTVVFHVAENIWWASEFIGVINDSIGKCNQSLHAIFKPIEIIDKVDAKELTVCRGEIKFENVMFNYSVDTNKEALFQDLSITILSAQRVGLVGYSGSGKSTFVNLVLRLYEIQSGSITIDEQDIQNVTQDSLHQNIGLIPQDPSLFHRTLMENIRYGKINATDEEVIIAAQKAHAHEFIIKTENKYESLVGERGIKLSGGQRQRIAIARAILKNAPILIMDEATSALDSVVEREIQDSLNQLMEDKTVIVIAHRLSTLLSMDRILVFDNGKIVEDGTHTELLSINGMYKKLWDAQVGGFLGDGSKS